MINVSRIKGVPHIQRHSVIKARTRIPGRCSSHRSDPFSAAHLTHQKRIRIVLGQIVYRTRPQRLNTWGGLARQHCSLLGVGLRPAETKTAGLRSLKTSRHFFASVSPFRVLRKDLRQVGFMVASAPILARKLYIPPPPPEAVLRSVPGRSSNAVETRRGLPRSALTKT